MKVIRGALAKLVLDGQFEVIIHGRNCHCMMGAGIARTIKQGFSRSL
jgi:O-acetyl-ADP-ribose deacetylase (regulator of RNase III)